ncbi:30S ribosomal protein S13, partial [Candidatus Pacearchaeota archaeon]|nr:30S ribosomal protein S13 [Candidatus Pacearchaeota archaeon]
MANEKKYAAKEQEDKILIRILGKDVRGDKELFIELTRIQGISWTFANAVCKVLKIDKSLKIQDISDKDIVKIEEFVKNPSIPGFLKNRQKDFEDGEDKHLSSIDLKLRREFDIKRLRKIKSYKGIRHGAGLPVRGQRTKSNFRKNRKP